MKKISLLILCIGICLTPYAQGVLKGKILDSATKKPLGLATVTVYKAADTAIVTYRLSTPEGDFRVPGIPIGIECRAVISFSGYAVFRKEFTIQPGAATLDLATIFMATHVRSLDEVLVVAERPPVSVRQDTIEFNAAAFKTLPNALVEDLLRKLPGVLVDKAGNIVVNGKAVNRILVDGKTFFGDDPKMATRNLPANVIDKVQVTDDKEQLMRNGDDNMNNVGKVINLTLKKGVKKGWFGKLYAGAGDGENTMYEAGGIANIYRDTFQISVLGYINNLNRPGFSYDEFMNTGGFDRVSSNSAASSMSMSTSNAGFGVSINGINMGGLQSGGGVSTSKGVGFNLNHAPNQKRSFFLQYFHGNVRTERYSTTDVNQYLADTIINNNTTLAGDIISRAHNFGTGLRLKPDSVTNILLNVTYMTGRQGDDRFTDVTGNNNKIGPLSLGSVDQWQDANVYVYTHSISLTRLSKTKKGRRFNMSHELSVDNRFTGQTSESSIQYFYPMAYDSIYAQLRQQRIPHTEASVQMNYSEPLNSHFTIRLGGRFEYNALTNGVNTFNRNNNGKYEMYNVLLSSDFRRLGQRYSVTPGLEYKWKDLVITPALRLQQQNVVNKQLTANIRLNQNQFDLLPGLSIRYKKLSFSYSKEVMLPGWTNLNPVADLSNPYYVTLGNPNLLPSERHDLSFNTSINNQKRMLDIGGWGNVNFTNKDVVQTYTLDEKGVQTTFPINVSGSRGAGMNAYVSKQYKIGANSRYSWYSSNWLSFTRNRLIFNEADVYQSSVSINHWIGTGISLNDVFEWTVNGSWNHSSTGYSGSMFKELNVTSYNFGNELVLRWPKHLIWETQLNYTYNDNIPAGMPKDMLNWNAALNIMMLKEERAALKLAMSDILNRNTNISVYANRNIITSSRSNVPGRYFLATFTYNVRAAGANKKVGRRGRFFLF